MTDDDYKRMYNTKKNSCSKRQIVWDLTLQQFITLYKLRLHINCAYTGRAFNYKKPNHDNYPTLERVDSTKGYEVGNVVFITSKVNKLKADYIECDKSMRGIGDANIHMVQRIKKVVENPRMLELSMQPYQRAFEELEESIKRVEDKINLEIEFSNKKKEEELEAIAQHNLELKFKAQHHFAKWYSERFNEFKDLGQLMQITLKEMRDLLRVTRDSVTKEPFETIWDKHLWVIDKSLPITKSNVKVVSKKTQESLDYLAGADVDLLKCAVKSLTKIL